jgi:hypothetical protein
MSTNVFTENEYKFRLHMELSGGTLNVNIYTTNHRNFDVYNPVQTYWKTECTF